MWISKELYNLLDVAKSSVDELRRDLTLVRQERDQLRAEQARDRTHQDWLINRINALELERVQLIQRAYQIQLPQAPQVVRAPMNEPVGAEFDPFADIGDDLASKLGISPFEHHPESASK